MLTPQPLPVPWSRKGRAIPLLPLWAVRTVQSLSACTKVHFTFTFIYYSKDRLNRSHNKLHVFTIMPMDITIQNQSINSVQIIFVDSTCQQSYLTLLSYLTCSPCMTQSIWDCNIHFSALLNKYDWAILHYCTNNCTFILHFLEHLCTRGRQASRSLGNSYELISESVLLSSFRESYPFNFSLSLYAV
jgi:hypothetical protein